MTATIPNIPIKKSKEEIDLYIKYSKEFNKALLYLKEIVEEGIYNSFEGLYVNFCYELFLKHQEINKITFPFQEEKNYLGNRFHSAICISPNNIVAHGRRESYIINKGDVLSVDCGICIHTDRCKLNFDAAFTAVYGEKSDSNSWIHKPQKALCNIVEKQPQDTKGISTIIRDTAKEYNLRQVVSLVGHGIGYLLHEPPVIHNAPADFNNIELFDGLVFCVEPIYVKPKREQFNNFIVQTTLDSTGWEISTVNNEIASHFETMFSVINGQIVDLIGITKW